MFKTSFVARSTRRFATLAAALTAASAFAQAQTPASDSGGSTIPLDRVVVSASRTSQDVRYTPSSVTVVPLDDLRTEQVASLSSALAEQPGAFVASTGALGGQTSVFLRGATPEQTLFVVDGVRMNDRAAEYLNFLGGADLGGVGRMEVLRGPQSTLYGSSAMGGVILINTARGAGSASGSLNVTAGSFSTYGASATTKGAEGAFSYSGSVAGLETDNDRPQNGFHQWSYSTRLEYAAAPGVLVGATFRGINGSYDEPGSRFYPYPGNVHSNNALTTVYGQVCLEDHFTSRLTLASHLRQYAWRSSGYYAPQSNNRDILDWQNTWSPTKSAEVVAGVNYEKSKYFINGGSTSDRVSAGYVSGTVRPIEAVTLTAGLRHDHFNSVGSSTTGRAGVAWIPVAGTKLHATYGTGFNAPATSDRYGVPDWGQLANPNLAPEKSKGWDAGIQQELAGGAVTLDATYFQNKFRNLFDWEYVDFVTYQGRTVNREHASTDGVELAATARLNARVKTRASYTYLSAHNDDTGARLLRRPRHAGYVEAQFQATTPWVIGAGLHLVAANFDGGAAFGGYTTARAFTSYAIGRNLLLKLRIENAFNRRYEEVYGYPALPRAVYGSVELRF